MKVYVAAAWSERALARIRAEQLARAGHHVTSRWLLDEYSSESHSEAQRAEWDLEDVDRSDALVLLTMALGAMFSSGGRMVELGYALGRGTKVIVLGPRENIFCYLPQVVQCETVDDLLCKLGRDP